MEQRVPVRLRAASYPGRLAVVVMLDTAAPDATEHAGGTRAAGRQRGSTAARDPLAGRGSAGHLAGGRAQAGLTVSSFGQRSAFASAEFERLVAAVPETRIVIEHLGGDSRPDADPNAPQQRRTVFGLSRYPNTYLKFHGFGELVNRSMPPREPFPFEVSPAPMLDEALAAFGPSRMLWGSDYSNVSAREGYTNALRFPRDTSPLEERRRSG